jgi:hypothetical protein
MIITYNTLCSNGYNLKLGGVTTEESKKKLSDGVYNYYKDKKFNRMKSAIVPEVDDYEKLLHILIVIINNMVGIYY